MTVDATQFYEPVVGEAYLDRLNVFDSPTAGLPDTFWHDLHRDLQLILGDLEKATRQLVPGCQVQAARTSGGSFFLFTYRAFEPTDKTIEPVVAGLTFAASGNDVRVEADISGEQSGDLITVLPDRIVPPSEAAVTEAARELAAELCRHGRQLAGALVDPARKLD